MTYSESLCILSPPSGFDEGSFLRRAPCTAVMTARASETERATTFWNSPSLSSVPISSSAVMTSLGRETCFGARKTGGCGGARGAPSSVAMDVVDFGSGRRVVRARLRVDTMGRMAEEKYRTLVLDGFVPQLSRMR